MGFDQGQIILDSDNGSYFSGQTVNAKLVFEQDKVKTFRGIYAKIKGYCEVRWTTRHTRQVSDGRGGRRSESYTVLHESHEVYLEHKIFLVGGESGEHHINPGKHEYPFSFKLPDNCPSSFEGGYGHIRYEVKVVVDRSFKLDQEKKIVLRVFAPLDLNQEPSCNDPIEIEFNNTYCCCCFSSGACETLVKLPKSGYCPGQIIPIEVVCSNKGNVEIETISFAIEQHTSYRATHNPATKHTEDTIAKLKKGPIPGNTTRTWTVEMEAPTIDVYNVSTCQFIDIGYKFKVKVSPDGCHRDSVETRPFVIGNIPLRGYQDNLPNPMQDQMPKQNLVTLNNHQASPNFGPVISQPMPNVPPYPGANPPYPGTNSPYPGANSPYPGANPPYPGANPPYPAANSPYPGANAPYPGANPPYPGAGQYPSPHPPGIVSSYSKPSYPGGAQPVSPYPPPYPEAAAVVPSLPPGANVPYPTGGSPTSPFVNASAPGLLPETPKDKKNMMGDDAANSPPFNPDFKG